MLDARLDHPADRVLHEMALPTKMYRLRRWGEVGTGLRRLLVQGGELGVSQSRLLQELCFSWETGLLTPSWACVLTRQEL